MAIDNMTDRTLEMQKSDVYIIDKFSGNNLGITGIKTANSVKSVMVDNGTFWILQTQVKSIVLHSVMEN